MQHRRSPARLALAVFACAAAALLAWMWTDVQAVSESAPLASVSPRGSAIETLDPLPEEPAADGEASADGTQADPAAVEAPAPQTDERQEVGATEREEPRQGSVHGMTNAPMGTVVLAARGGVLPLDCAAIAWPLEPGGSAPDEVRRSVVRFDGSFDLGRFTPGPLRVLLLPPPGSDAIRLERDDLWVLAGDTDLGALVVDSAGPRQVLFQRTDGEAVTAARLFLAPTRLSGPVRALGWPACSELFPLEEALPLYRLPAGRSTLLALAPGCAPTWVEAGLFEASNPTPLAIELAPAAPITGELIDVDGLELGGLRVGGISLRGPRLDPADARAAGIPGEALLSFQATKSDEEGRFVLQSLEAGEAILLRAAGDDRLDLTDAFTPEVVAYAGDSGIELERRKGAELSFELVDARDGRGIEPFRAELRGISGSEDVIARRFPSSKALWRDIRPLSRSLNSLFADLPESDDLMLWLEADGFSGSVGRSFRLQTGERLELGTLRLEPRAPLHVLVLDAQDHEPLARARCELQPLSPFGAEPSIFGSTDRAGRVSLAPRLDLPHDLYVRCDGHAPWRGRVVAATSSDAPWTVELARGASLRVTVLDGEQQPLHAEVLRRRFGPELGAQEYEAYETVLTDAQGVAEFSDLEPGLASVAARALPRADLDLPADPAALTWFSVGVPAGGAGAIEISAPHSLRLDLHLSAPRTRLAHALVRLAPDPDAFRDPHADAARLAAWPTARANSLGEVVFDGLPARDYAIRVEHPDLEGFGRAVVRLEPKSQVQRVEVRQGHLVGLVLDQEGQTVQDATVVAWALGTLWDEELEVAPRATLEEIAPKPIVLDVSRTEDDGVFSLWGPTGVQVVVTAQVRGTRRVGDYWLEELPRADERAEPIAVQTSPGVRLHVRLMRLPGALEPRSPGVVALCLDQPWGRGVVAAPLENDELVLDDVPPGRWKLCPVELSHKSVILEVGPWGWVDELPQDEPILLRWP
jgi:hypothetical protein